MKRIFCFLLGCIGALSVVATTNEYNPTNPDDPWADGYMHRVYITNQPSVGGRCNIESQLLYEKAEENIYAYPNTNYRFVCWKQEGKIISTTSPLTITMDTADMYITAQFVYDPENPANPDANYFDALTGELIMDDFTSGRLSDAIDGIVGYNNYSLVTKITIAGQMSSYDFGFANNMTNCHTIDLARTTGYTEVPSYSFDYNTALQTIFFPYSVEKIGNYAFSGCSNLKDIYCYAVTPPIVGNNAFQNVSDELIVHVPAVSVDLYKAADGWKGHSIVAMESETCKLTVNLPNDAKDGRYKNMTLVLDNITSGQVTRLLITDRTKYDVYLVPYTKYNVYVKNTNSATLGSINEIEVKDKDVEVSFTSLKQPQTVTLSVINFKGEDMTTKLDISWYDEDGKYIGIGNKVDGYVEGYKLKYHIKLSDVTALSYASPKDSTITVAEANNNFRLALDTIRLITIKGCVKNINSKQPIRDANVTITQQTSGKQKRSVVAQTDNKGVFTAQIFLAPASIFCSATNYINSNLEISNFTIINDSTTLEDLLLTSAVGGRVNISLTYQESVLETETAEIQNWYGDYGNVEYSIYNLSTEHEIREISNRYPQLVLMGGVQVGDSLRITAASRKNTFEPVMVKCKVDSTETTDVTFAIKQLGGLTASYKTTRNENVVGMLYDANGLLQLISDYSDDQTVTFKDLRDGSYTLVSMGKKNAYNAINRLDRLAGAGLLEGTDYTQSKINIESGVIKSITLDSIPYFNESKFKTINLDKSYVSVNKASIIAGNVLTFTTNVELQNNVSLSEGTCLIVDLPSSASFVEGSVMIGNQIVKNYTLSQNTLTIPISYINGNNRVKFCVIPTESGQYTQSALIRFYAEKEAVIMPIGSARYEVKQMSISLPSESSKKEITISGTAAPNVNISIYDEDVLIGNTTSNAQGTWMVLTNLNKPLDLSAHNIHAETKIVGDINLLSETKTCIYNPNCIEVKKITMIYNSKVIIFDYENPYLSLPYYSFNPSYPTFTFQVELTNNDTNVVSDVELFVFTSDGKYTELETEYNKEQNVYVAKEKFDSYSLPINVSVSFTTIKRQKADVTSSFNMEVEVLDDMRLDAINNIGSADLSLTIDEDSLSVFDIILPSSGIVGTFTIEVLDYQTTYNRTKIEQFDFEKTESGYRYTLMESLDNPSRLIMIDTGQKMAFAFSILNTKDDASQNNSKKAASKVSYAKSIRILKNYFRSGDWVSELNSLGSDMSDVLGLKKYLTLPNYSQYLDIMDSYMSTLESMETALVKALSAKCKDGQYRLTLENRKKYSEQIQQFDTNIGLFYNAFLSYIDLHKSKLLTSAVMDAGIALISLGVGEGIGVAVKPIANSGRILKNSKNANYFKLWVKSPTARSWIENGLDVGFSKVIDGITDMINPEEADFVGVENEMNQWMVDQMNTYSSLYRSILNNIKNSYQKCPPKQDPKTPPTPKTPNVPYTIDPSGFVYEGIFDNRLEGVTTTCYYKETIEDTHGDLVDNIVKWDAEEYGQENPLITDKEGFYQWFVPAGLWQVKYEKEGYETAYSEWLPVPPPQLEVNIGLVQNRQPEVKEAHAYKDGIEMTFDKYMMPTYLNASNIKVSQNGKYVDGEVKLLDETIAYKDENVKYASRVRFVPAAPLASNKEITLVVANRVKSYAGIPMAETFTQSFDVEKEVKQIVADSVAYVPYSGSKVITIYALPADASAGKTIHAQVASDMIASLEKQDIVIGSNGKAQFTINGELPGTTGITFSIDGVYATATTIANVGESNTTYVEKPFASVSSGSLVDAGTTVSLMCTAEDVAIYYTVDNTSPVTSETRMLYDQPIEINSDTYIKAVAVNNNDQYSDVAEFSYIVDTTKLIEESSRNTNITKFVQGEQLLILRDGKIYNSLGIEIK